ncbi:MAG: DNA primase [Candidatus Paceibacterota bacterium]|jgi:DNA primase
MDSPVKQIKERLGIEEVASSYIKLERAGVNLKARCPFHNEKTPSFFLSPDRGTYYCFGCGASGDIFSFVEEFEGLDFKGALKMLAERAGVELPRYNKAEESEKEKLYRVMEEATKYFCANVTGHPEIVEYLKSRGLTDKSIQDFRIGFAKLEWRELHAHLRKSGWKDAEMEKAGLIKKAEKAGPGGEVSYYDRFRGRVMFPIADSSGRVVAFSGRIFQDDGKSAKYLNSPETPIFSKNAVLYGIDKAKEHIRKNNFSILVEGQMDLIMSHQAGYRNAVATSGTALSDSEFSKENAVSNLGLVRRLSPNIVLAFDGDQAGEKAAERAGKIALSLGMDVKVADFPPDSDPADLIKTGGADAWRDVIKNSKHIIEFVVAKILKKDEKDIRKAGREIKEKALVLVAALGSSIEKAHFLKRISEMSGIGEGALEDDFKKIEQESVGERAEIGETKAAQDAMRRKDYIKRKLLGLVLWQKSLKEETLDTKGIVAELETIFHTKLSTLLEEVRSAEDDMIFEAEVFYEGGADVKKDAEEMVLNLKEEILKEELAGKMRELYRAEDEKDQVKSAEIFKLCQLINNQIQDIKNGRLKN